MKVLRGLTERYAGEPVNLRLLSLTLVVVVGALVASSYADGLRVPRVLAECPRGLLGV